MLKRVTPPSGSIVEARILRFRSFFFFSRRASRHTTYPLEARSVSRAGAVSAHHIPIGGPERVESGSCLDTPHTHWRPGACRERELSRHTTYPLEARSVPRAGAVSTHHIPIGGPERVESGSCLDTPHTHWRPGACRERELSRHTTYPLEARSVSRAGAVSTHHIPIGGPERVESGSCLDTPHTHWRPGACRERELSRHTTYPLEARSVPRAGAVSTHHIPIGGPERAESGSCLDTPHTHWRPGACRERELSRHTTYPLEARSVSRAGAVSTHHIPIGGPERVESGSCLGTPHTHWRPGACRERELSRHTTYPLEARSVSRAGAVSTHHIPNGGPERVESGSCLGTPHTHWRPGACRERELSQHTTYPLEARSVSRAGAVSAHHIPIGGPERVESGSCLDTPHTHWRPGACRERELSRHTTYPLEARSVSRAGAVSTHHIPIGGPERVESGSCLGTPHTHWRPGACRERELSRHTTYPLEARSVSRAGAVSAHHIPIGGPERAESGSCLDTPHTHWRPGACRERELSRHTTYPLEARSMSRAGAVSTHHIPIEGPERVESGSCLGTPHTHWRPGACRERELSRHTTYPMEARSVSRAGAVSAHHIPIGGPERVESGSCLGTPHTHWRPGACREREVARHTTYPLEARSVSRAGAVSAHHIPIGGPEHAESGSCLDTPHTHWRPGACRERELSRHTTYPLEARSVPRAGAVSTHHIPIGGPERVESGSCLGTPHTHWRPGACRERELSRHTTYPMEARSVSRAGAVSTHHIPIGGPERVESGSCLGTPHTHWRPGACRERELSRHTTYPLEAKNKNGIMLLCYISFIISMYICYILYKHKC